MKVKIGDTIYDSANEPIMIILDEQDKFNLANMHPESYKYCSFPGNADYSPDFIKKWMAN